VNLGRVRRDEWADDGTTLILETALDFIRQEIADDYEAGKVKPFVEGEQIGMRQPRRMLVTYIETPEKRWERRQKALRALRARNDHRIREELAS